MIKINNIKVSVENKEILRGVSLDINAGEVVVVMGKNGSGKSTMANTLMAHPKYILDDGAIELDGEDITELSPDERANKGLFLASQYPMAVPGLTANSFLWQIYKKRTQFSDLSSQKVSILEFRKWIEEQAKLLDLDVELLKRGLNDGLSGGEKKKLEIMQMLVFGPKYIILDEIDSGLDVDALKKISTTIASVAKSKKIGVLVITHYNRILKYLVPDKVVVMEDGKIVKEGGAELANVIEEEGYKK